MRDLTPESAVITSIGELSNVRSRFPFPVFVKGAIKSNKDQGWAACVAQDSTQLEAITKDLLARERRSRGRVIVRRLVRFRPIGVDKQNFPIGREYRAFIYRQQVLAYAFYWDEYKDSTPLSEADKRAINALCLEASRRVGTPYISLDVGQLEDGKWTVIEISDGQFAGLSQVGLFELWSKLVEVTARAPNG